MSDLDVRLHKPTLAIVGITWILAAVSFIAPTALPGASIFQGIGIFLVVAHAIEVLVYRGLLSNVKEVLLVMFCGILFIKAKGKAIKRQAAA